MPLPPGALTRLILLGLLVPGIAAAEPHPDDGHADLIEAFRAAVDEAEGRPAEEMIHLASLRRPLAHEVELLSGERSAESAKQLDAARQRLARMTEAIRERLDWPVPEPTTIPHTSDAPRIDGALDEAAWGEARRLACDVQLDHRKPVDAPRTAVRMMWDERFIYVGFDCADAQLLAPALERDAAVYNHDAVEVFLMPDRRTASYWEVVVGAGGAIFDALHTKYPDRFGSLSRPTLNMRGLAVAVRVDGTLNDASDTDERFTVEMAIPFAELPEYSRSKPEVGDGLYFMLARIDRNDPARRRYRAYACAPMLTWMHNVNNYGKLTLVEALDD